MSKSRNVSVNYRYELYNVALEGQAKHKGNRRLSMFSLTAQEAHDLVMAIITKWRVNKK